MQTVNTLSFIICTVAVFYMVLCYVLWFFKFESILERVYRLDLEDEIGITVLTVLGFVCGASILLDMYMKLPIDAPHPPVITSSIVIGIVGFQGLISLFSSIATYRDKLPKR